MSCLLLLILPSINCHWGNVNSLGIIFFNWILWEIEESSILWLYEIHFDSTTWSCLKENISKCGSRCFHCSQNHCYFSKHISCLFCSVNKTLFGNWNWALMHPFQKSADTSEFLCIMWYFLEKNLAVCVISNLQTKYFNVIFLVTESKSFSTEYKIIITYPRNLFQIYDFKLLSK